MPRRTRPPARVRVLWHATVTAYLRCGPAVLLRQTWEPTPADAVAWLWHQLTTLRLTDQTAVLSAQAWRRGGWRDGLRALERGGCAHLDIGSHRCTLRHITALPVGPAGPHRRTSGRNLT